MRFLLILLLLLVSGCATPRVWVARRDDNSGVIAYQNYSPSSDNGARIKELIPCYPYQMIANPVYGRNVAPTAYGYSSSGNGTGGFAYALDGGYVETAEFHYKCEPTKPIKTSQDETDLKSVDPKTINECRSQCLLLDKKDLLPKGNSLADCYHRMCGQ